LWATYRYTVEQYLWTSFLRKHGKVSFAHKTDFDNDAIAVSELTIANNLVLCDLPQLQLRFLKYPLLKADWASSYTHGEWLRLYKKYCDGNLELAPDTLAWRKRAYDAMLTPAFDVLSSPASSSVWGRKISNSWKARSPESFRVAKNALASFSSFLKRDVQL